MIRPAVDAHIADILDIVVSAGMFTRDEVEVVDQLVREHLAAHDHQDHCCVVSEQDGTLTGVAFAEVRPAADRVWDLTMIGVRPTTRRVGDGTALIIAVEQQLTTAGARLLVVETPATQQYEGARAFYTARGYDDEARIRDYWTDGDDLVLFRKRLSTSA